MSAGSMQDAGTPPQTPARSRPALVRWALALPLQRKILVFLAGGMVTLVFDAFIAHFSWKNLTMKWTQSVPIVYGLLASVILAVAALFALPARAHNRLVVTVGALGMGVGLTGITLHSLAIAESLKGEEVAVTAIGKALQLSPPLFAPAAFAGVGLLLIALHRIAPLNR
jgi:hypothetical protein